MEKDLSSQQTNYAYQEQGIYILRCFFVEEPPGKRLNRLVRISTTDETTKDTLCQEKSAFRNPYTVNNF
jgi:hypothetical protein